MPASLELVKIALQAYGNGDCEIALALADPLIRWDERASRTDGDLVWKHEDVQRAMQIKRFIEDLGVNLAGVEVIMRLTDRLREQEEQIADLRARLKASEDEIRMLRAR